VKGFAPGVRTAFPATDEPERKTAAPPLSMSVFDFSAVALTLLSRPTHAQGMEYEGISNCEPGWFHNGQKGVPNKWIECHAPRLVIAYPAAMFAGWMCVVLVALTPGGRACVRHMRPQGFLFCRNRHRPDCTYTTQWKTKAIRILLACAPIEMPMPYES